MTAVPHGGGIPPAFHGGATPLSPHGASSGSDDALLALEQATLRACAVDAEREVDGWLLRLSPGKAKRSRSAQPLAAGSLPLDEKLRDLVARCRDAGLPPLVRLTPFSQPPGLDAALAQRGWHAFDESLVMWRPLAPAAGADTPGRSSVGPVDVDGATHAAWVGAQRGSSSAEIAGHAARLAGSPVPYRAVHLLAPSGAAVAGGQIAVDADGFGGLYDVFVDPGHRRAGHARTLCTLLVARAAASGATTAYLQVDAGNAAAIALYRSLGFSEGYRYHYRQAPAAPAARAGAGASSRP